MTLSATGRIEILERAVAIDPDRAIDREAGFEGHGWDARSRMHAVGLLPVLVVLRPSDRGEEVVHWAARALQRAQEDAELLLQDTVMRRGSGCQAVLAERQVGGGGPSAAAIKKVARSPNGAPPTAWAPTRTVAVKVP